MHARERADEPAVPLVRDEADRARLGHGEVGPRDAHVGGLEDLPQAPAGEAGERLELRLDRLPGDPREERRDVGPRLLERRRDDVPGMLAGELEDPLAEVGLDRLDARRGERLVETDLLAQHRLALGGHARARAPADLDGRPAGVGGRRAPVDDAAAGLHRLLEGRQVVVEPVDRARPDRAGPLPELLRVPEQRPRLQPLRPHARGGRVERGLARGVGERVPSDGAETGGRLSEPAHAATPRARAVARCTTRGPAPTRSARPRRCTRQPGSAVTIASAPAAEPSLSSAIATETSGWRTENVPPKPQHRSSRGSGTSVAPEASSSRRGCSRIPSSRSMWHESW